MSTPVLPIPGFYKLKPQVQIDFSKMSRDEQLELWKRERDIHYHNIKPAKGPMFTPFEIWRNIRLQPQPKPIIATGQMMVPVSRQEIPWKWIAIGTIAFLVLNK